MEEPVAIPSGGSLGSRPLLFTFMLDCSGSMAGRKIEALNKAIQDAIPHLKKVAEDNPNASLMFRVLEFQSGAQWQSVEPISINQFVYHPLQASGGTDMGLAFKMVADQLRTMPERGLPPVLVLVSDGCPMDNWKSGLAELNGVAWAKKSVRIAIAIDCEENSSAMAVLQEFLGNPEKRPITVNEVDNLGKEIRLKSTVAIKDASEQGQGPGATYSPGPAPMQTPVYASPTAASAPAAQPTDSGNWIL